ncbi:MAG: proton-conducting transporter membrane subunit, partial [Nitrospirota bacterium]
ILILADNLLLLFLGWEGIGLCSYLLIGFRHEQKSAIQTGLQAFVKSRLGNAGIFIGLIMLGLLFGTLTYTELFAAVQAGTHEYLVLGIPISALSLITILLFAGIHAQISFLKSADPLDCPAPAVALIHASVSIAVTYFLVRCSSLFVSGFPLVLVALVGAGWIVYGGFLCFLDNSPRRMIAFSTISQTGYLFLALGMSAFSSAIFHLTVHTFLKTLLLLGISCMVFTALKDKQRNRSTYLPIAKGTFFIGMMALAGLLPFGIFLSQNGILWDMITTSLAGKIFSMVGIAGIFMTSYCSFRILYGTTSDGDHSQQEELSVPMIIPLLVLTFLTIGTSLLGFPGYVIPDLFQEYFSSFFSIQEDDLGSGWSMFGLMAIAAGAVVAGWRLAHALHRKNVPLPEVFVQKAARIQALFSVFTVLHARFAMLARTYGQALSSKGERAIVNRVSDWIMNTISRISAYGRKLHNGSVQYYACCMIIGMLIFGGVYFLLS